MQATVQRARARVGLPIGLPLRGRRRVVHAATRRHTPPHAATAAAAIDTAVETTPPRPQSDPCLICRTRAPSPLEGTRASRTATRRVAMRDSTRRYAASKTFSSMPRAAREPPSDLLATHPSARIPYAPHTNTLQRADSQSDLLRAHSCARTHPAPTHARTPHPTHHTTPTPSTPAQGPRLPADDARRLRAAL